MVNETVKVNIPRSSYIETNGIKMHVMRAGYAEGEPVVLLHGFPEFWYGWHNQIQSLAEAGYRVIVPDQRGYNLTDKPQGVDAYTIDKLVADVLGLLDALEYDKVRLVAHDWGAMVAWYFAMHHPDRVQQLVIMNVPHPKVYSTFVRTTPEQMLRSWYVGAFQIPALPEAIARMTNYSQFANIMREQANLRDDQLRRYVEAWGQPGAMTAMINWYRAAARYQPDMPDDGRIHVPTLVLWGMEDFALSHKMAEPSAEMADEGRLVMFKGASHFVQHDRAERVNELLLAFFSKGINWDAEDTENAAVEAPTSPAQPDEE